MSVIPTQASSVDVLNSVSTTTPLTYPQGGGGAVPEQNIEVTATPLDDNRVRLKPYSAARQQILGPNEVSNILYPLYRTNGILFPYTPTIQFTQDVDWKSADLTHSNYDTASYGRTPAVSLSVSGKFTVQTTGEGRYLLAVLHFLRTVSKMYFGKSETDKKNGRAGLPPPVLKFSGYGPYMYNDVKVVVKNHSYSFDDTVNMVPFDTGPGERVSLPAILTLSMTLGVVQTPAAQRDEFDLDKFRTGELMRGRGGWL